MPHGSMGPHDRGRWSLPGECQPQHTDRMFVRSYMEVDRPFEEVRTILLDRPDRWLPGLATEAGERGALLLAEVGFGGDRTRVATRSPSSCERPWSSRPGWFYRWNGGRCWLGTPSPSWRAISRSHRWGRTEPRCRSARGTGHRSVSWGRPWTGPSSIGWPRRRSRTSSTAWGPRSAP